MNNIKSEIGEATLVLRNKTWGKTLVNGKLKSEEFWKRKLDNMINGFDVDIDPKDQPLKSGILDKNGNPDIPIPFEIEVGIPDLNYAMLLEAWRRTF